MSDSWGAVQDLPAKSKDNLFDQLMRKPVKLILANDEHIVISDDPENNGDLNIIAAKMDVVV